MDGTSASSGCWAGEAALALDGEEPAAPSLRNPESTRPITRPANASAAERNRGSTAGRAMFSRGPRPSRITTPGNTSMW